MDNIYVVYIIHDLTC